MSEFFCTKVKTATGYALMPAHQQDLDEIKKLPKSQPLRIKVTRIRNVQFFRKWWALVDYLYTDVWDPEDLLDCLGNPVQKSRDRFRKDLTLLCGFYEAFHRINGEIRYEAVSLAFDKMSEEQFTELFDKTIEVAVKYIASNYTGDELRQVVDQVMEFDS